MNPLGPDKTCPNGSPGEDNGAERIAWPPTQTGRWLRSLVQHASDVIGVLDSDGALRYVSPAVERMLGYTPEEMVGTEVFDYIHPDDFEKALGAFAETLETPGALPAMEFRVRCADGSWRPVEVVRSNRLNDPNIEGVVVNVRDITERKRAEERLREAEERYRSLVERIPVITYLQEPTSPSRTTYLSPQFEAIFGYSVEEVLADPEHWVKMIHPDDRERVLTEDERTNESGKPFVMEYRQVTRSGRVVWVRDEATLVRGEEDEPLYWHGVMSDVTERKALEERLEHQAFHDPLTCLPNRYLFMNRLEHALVRATRRRGTRIGVLFIDLDAFKMVNDSLGHENGDRLLVSLAERIRGCLRPEDTMARFGGDEFTVLLEDVEGPDEAVRVAGRIADELRDPFALEGRELFVKTSIGIALGDASTRNPESLLRDADTAMYRAKEEGVNYKVFDEAMHGRVVSRMELESDLRRAIEREEFVVHYQPIVNLQTGGLWGLEALVRWDHPERGLVSPREFVPIAEETGLIVPLGRWVLEEACRSAREWQGAHPHAPPLIISVNLSAKQLGSPDLARMVEAAIRESGLEHYCLSLDVTETAYIKVLEGYAAALDRLKAMGVRVSIDDFGTGYSSLSYLKRLPADDLKIDRTFVKGLGEDIEDTAIVRMIIDLAHTVGMEVVAEGVESAEQARLLRELGCDLAQGFHFSKPLPPQRVPAFLTA